jgi:hydroxymethylpyrimidine/phosphomethylpyrimidine kinase
MPHKIPVALTIAGSDCSGGAGIQADLKTFQHLHVHGLTALTCVVSETANIVRAVHPIPVDILADQVSLLLDSFPIAAIKTGMLFSAEHVAIIAKILANYPHIPLVIDPVMLASTGDSLLEPTAIECYQSHLLPLARLMTPNLAEAEVLLGKAIPDAESLETAAQELSQIFGTAVLLKGGHLDGPECLDLLVDNGKVFRFSAPRIAVTGSHGTGCTLSAAITAHLAHGESLPRAVELSKTYLGNTLEHSYQFPSSDGKSIHALNQGTRF